MSPVPEPQWPMTSTPVRSPVACSASQPVSWPGLQDLARQLEAALGDDLFVGQALQQPVPQHPELQAVEQLVGRLPVPRLAHAYRSTVKDRSRSRIKALTLRLRSTSSVRAWNASAALPFSSPACMTRFSSPS